MLVDTMLALLLLITVNKRRKLQTKGDGHEDNKG